eukprot:29441-Pelagococcus_subviridis.AAC.3
MGTGVDVNAPRGRARRASPPPPRRRGRRAPRASRSGRGASLSARAGRTPTPAPPRGAARARRRRWTRRRDRRRRRKKSARNSDVESARSHADGSSATTAAAAAIASDRTESGGYYVPGRRHRGDEVARVRLGDETSGVPFPSRRGHGRHRRDLRGVDVDIAPPVAPILVVVVATFFFLVWLLCRDDDARLAGRAPREKIEQRAPRRHPSDGGGAQRVDPAFAQRRRRRRRRRRALALALALVDVVAFRPRRGGLPQRQHARERIQGAGIFFHVGRLQQRGEASRRRGERGHGRLRVVPYKAMSGWS